MLKRITGNREPTESEILENDIDQTVYGKKSIYGLVKKYGKQKQEKIIRYKIIGIKRRLNDIEEIRKDLNEMIKI